MSDRVIDVLIVEDDDSTAKAIRTILHQRLNAEVRWASCLTEARTMLTDRVPDCVLLDLMLPDGDGEELIEDADREGWHTRFVVVTACGPGSPRLARAAVLKPYAIQNKPYDLDTLMARVSGVSEPMSGQELDRVSGV